jgi:hypothetical protein
MFHAFGHTSRQTWVPRCRICQRRFISITRFHVYVSLSLLPLILEFRGLQA